MNKYDDSDSVYNNTQTRQILFEKLYKISYVIKKEQKKFRNIDVGKEILGLLRYGEPMPGCYLDNEFILEYNFYKYE